MIETTTQVPAFATQRPRSRLIGRDREVAELIAILEREDVALATITGPGGVGKTRVALEVAQVVAGASNDGVWLVPLAPVRDPALLPSAIAHALGLREAADTPPAELVRRYLADRRALLVLDNVEQIMDAAWFVASIIESCPGVTVLATSRTRLRLSDEREYPLPPLATPPIESDPTPEAACESDAVRLFVERAQAVSPRFRLEQGNVAAVSEICRRLDGQPLAIELAAVRIKALAPRALLDRLDDSLSLLVEGRRDAPARQRTMRDAIAWSHDLLSEAERAVLRRLSVFVGGFSLEAAAAVCDDPGMDAIGVVAALVDQSLVQRIEPAAGDSPDDGDETAPTHRLLETVREFGLEQLAARGETDAVRTRHAAYFAELAERRRPAHDLGTSALAMSDLHLANWRAVLTWSRETGNRTAACGLASSLMTYWAVRCHVAEGRAWFEWILEAGEDDLPADLRAVAQVGVGLFAKMQGDYRTSAAHLEPAIRHFRVSGDTAQLGRALQWRGESLLRSGDAKSARDHFLESLEISRAGGSVIRDGGWAAWPLRVLSYVAAGDGEMEQATALMEESLAVARATGSSCATVDALVGLADIARSGGREVEAATLLGEALALSSGVGNTGCVVMTIGDLGTLSATRGGGPRAAELLGAQAGQLELIHLEPPPATAAAHALARNQLQRELGETPYEMAFDRGRRSPLTASVELALAEAERLAKAGAEAGGRSNPAAPLSVREAEVVGLLAAGMSDREIAEVLFVSKRTVSTHVSNILTKLDLTNRAEAAAWAVRRGLA